MDIISKGSGSLLYFTFLAIVPPRMRKLGYPPGWLKEARLQHSGMNLYNSEGVLVTEETNERDKIFEAGDRDQYDVRKIKDFPGFNVRPPSGTKEVVTRIKIIFFLITKRMLNE